MTTLLRARDIAAVLNCSVGHAYELLASGEITPTKVGETSGGRTLVRATPEALQAFIERRTLSP